MLLSRPEDVIIKKGIMKYTFSGHESFHCKSLWLKKGYDFAKAEKSFNDDSAVVDLGVGKNMVASIKFWLKSFGIIDESGEVTETGDLLFADDGFDPYVEDVATQWLLHYLLVSTEYATIYHIVFAEFNKNRKDFSKSSLLNYLKRLFADKRFDKTPYNENTISRDIATLLKNYARPENPKVYEDFSSALIDLNLIKRIDRDNFEFNTSTKAAVEPLIFLYAILDIANGESVVEYSQLLYLAGIFGMTTNDMYDAFESINSMIPSISFSNSAGEQLFTINEPISKNEVLNMYYRR